MKQKNIKVWTKSVVIAVLLFFFAGPIQVSAINVNPLGSTGYPPIGSTLNPGDQGSVSVSLTREQSEAGLNITYTLGLVVPDNVSIIERNPDCSQANGVTACIDEDLGSGRSYDPLFRFRVLGSAPNGSTITFTLRLITNSGTQNIPVSFIVGSTATACETSSGNGDARCFAGNSCTDENYTLPLTGPNTECGASRICCQNPPDAVYDCDNLTLSNIDCQGFEACSPPGTDTQCSAGCNFGYTPVPIDGRGCGAGLVCCMRAPIPNNGCESNYSNAPYLADCRSYCSDDKPFVMNPAVMPNVSCPGVNNIPQICCSAVNPTNNQPPPNHVCVLGSNTDGSTRYGVRVPIGNGCIPVLSDIVDSSAFILSWSAGIAGLVSILLITYAGFMIMTSAGDASKVQAGQELITATISGLIFLVFSVFLLRLIGSDILGIFR